MLAVVDTNIWISAVISPEGFCAPLVDELRAGGFSLAVCPLIQQELTRVLSRPRFREKYLLTGSDIAGIVMLTARRATWFDDPPIVPVSRDPRDDIFIAATLASGAEYLVSRDDDLKRDRNVLTYLESQAVSVVTIREFLELCRRP